MEDKMAQSKQEAVARLILRGNPDPSSQSDNHTMLDTICRATMRNISSDAQDLIVDIKEGLNHVFNPMTDAQIQSVLNCAEESRGHFQSVQTLRDFCSGALQAHSSSLDIAAVDGIVSAINYARFNASVDAEIKPIIAGLSAGAPAYIGNAYPERGQDMLKRVPRQEDVGAELDEKIVARQRRISNASQFGDYDGMGNKPKKEPGRQAFEPQGYPKLAADSGVPIIGHVSGTIPGNLAVINNLLIQGPKGAGLSEDQAHVMAGLTAASFHRSAFHSPPEVLVGLRHYLGNTATKDNVPQNEMEVKQLYRESLELIAGSSSPDLKADILNVIDDLVQNPLITVEEEVNPARFVEVDLDADEQEIDELMSEIDELESLRDLELASVDGDSEEPLMSPETEVSKAKSILSSQEAKAQLHEIVENHSQKQVAPEAVEVNKPSGPGQH